MPSSDRPWLIGNCAELPSCFPYLQSMLIQHDVQSFCSVSVTLGSRPIGVLTLGRDHRDAFTEVDAHILRTVCIHIAFVVERAMEKQDGVLQQSAFLHEHDLLLSAREVAEAVISELNLHLLLLAVSKSIRRLCGAEYADLLLYDAHHDAMRRAAVSFERCKDAPSLEGGVHQLDETTGVMAFRMKKPLVTTSTELVSF
jgi:GAF domain-containing protein